MFLMLFNGKVFVPLPHKAKQSASFSPNGNLRTPCLRKRDMKVKVGNVVQLFPRYHSADFCHIPPSRFLRTSVAEYRHEVCAFRISNLRIFDV